MTDYVRLHEIARKDVHACIEIWKEILEQLDIKYAYAKGSVTKRWDSPIDYVPEISDVDIHISLRDATNLFPSSNEFVDAMRISEDYERRFHEVRKDPLHFPRSQIMVIEHLKNVLDYVPPRIEDIKILFGKVNQLEFPDIDSMRKKDLANLIKLEEYLQGIPMRVVDRAGFDFWSVIRTMTFRVSPSPVRILSQTHDNPIDIWSWNRTRIELELRNQGYDQIAHSYRGFYESGWDLFLSEFKNLKAFRSVVNHGYNLLKQCLDEGRKFIRR